MNNSVTIEVPVQLECFDDQFVRARPLGPWKLQVVGSSWEDVEPRLVRQLDKALRQSLPTDLFAGGFTQGRSQPIHWRTSALLPPPERSSRWSEPLDVELDSFRWSLEEGQCLVRIPAVNCVLFARAEDLSHEVIQDQAQMALLRLAENRDLLELAHRFSRMSYSFRSLPMLLPIGGQAEDKDTRQQKRKRTATLRAAASNLNKTKLANVYGLDEKAAELADFLRGETSQSVLIVGPAGVGKTSLVYRLVAMRHMLGLSERTIWSTSGSRIISGMCGLGMWQQRCSKLIRQAHATGGILHLGSLFELQEAGKIDGQPGVASMVRQSISRGKLLAIAECTEQQLAVIERDDPMLVRAFTRLEMNELDEPKIREILRSVAEHEFLPQGTEFSEQAIEELMRLHARFATYSALPAAALRLMRNVGDEGLPSPTSQARHEVASNVGDATTVDVSRTLCAADVARAFARQTGLPQFLVDDSISVDLSSIAQSLSAQVVGQSEPVDLLVDLIATLKARMVRPGRPLASLMFIGPTGVGKTEMAKAIARLLYSDAGRMIRIDMSEYASPWSAVKLIGKPGEGDGALTSPIREQPFSVVLLDEFEKADSNVFDMLLQLLGEGRLTDAQGRLADFRNAVVIMTSNLGAESFRQGNVGFGDNETSGWREHFEREVRRFVRPEFLGRLDRIVPFRPLPRNVVRQIARRELERLRHRPGLKYSAASVEFTDAVVDLLSEMGYEPKYGARPLRRAIEFNVVVPLANALSRITPDSSWRLTVDTKQGNVTIETQKLSTKHKTDKQLENECIDAWQELGNMARAAETCNPVRDLENEVERTRRQIEFLERRVKSAEGPRRTTELKVQLLQSQALIEAANRVRGDLSRATERICTSHDALLLAWYRGQAIDWPARQAECKTMVTELRQTLENLLGRRASSSQAMSLIVVSPSETRLETLFRAYRLLAEENNWLIDLYLLRNYDPRYDPDSNEYRRLVSERKIDPQQHPDLQPDLRLSSPTRAADDEIQYLADAFRHGGSTEFNPAGLTQVRGFAIQARGTGVESWLENESGVVHFYDATATGGKRRMRVRVTAYPGALARVQLAADWLEPTAAGEKDPRRVIDLAGQQIHVGDQSTYVDFAAGKVVDGLLALMRREHELALWSMIGYEGIPSGAKLRDALEDVPF